MRFGAHRPMPVELLARPKGRIAPCDIEERRQASRQLAQPLLRSGIAAIWRETFVTFGGHAPAIVLFALVGFAGPAIVCIILSVVLQLDFYGQVSGPFATRLGTSTLRDGPVNPVSVLLWVQAGMGMVGLAFARGLIARLAVSDAKEPPSLNFACREAMGRLPSLLIGSLIYGATIMAGAVGMNAVLHDTDFDLSFVGQQTITLPGHAQVLGLRALDAFVPSPGSPLAEFVPAMRHTAFEPFTQIRLTGVQGMEGYGIDKVSVKARPDLQWLIVLTSISLLILAEALLRFTPVMAMRSHERARLRAITPVLRSVGFGMRHFGAITMHVWLLQLAFVAAYSVFFMLPVVLAQGVAPAAVRGVTSSLIGKWSLLLTLACYWLVMALFMAFSAVYDTRLVLALAPKVEVRTVVGQTMPMKPAGRATSAAMSTSK